MGVSIFFVCPETGYTNAPGRGREVGGLAALTSLLANEGRTWMPQGLKTVSCSRGTGGGPPDQVPWNSWTHFSFDLILLLCMWEGGALQPQGALSCWELSLWDIRMKCFSPKWKITAGPEAARASVCTQLTVRAPFRPQESRASLAVGINRPRGHALETCSCHLICYDLLLSPSFPPLSCNPPSKRFSFFS